jgi:hypothetical protein
MSFINLSSKLIVVARGINFFPREKLQFRHAKFYQDTGLLLSLPYYEMAYGTNQLFTDQFISVGTNGFGLQLPYYYTLSARGSGVVTLRHDQQFGNGIYSVDPSWAIDVIQSYSEQGDKRYEGSYGFTGLTSGDWGFHWTHSQEFNAASQGALYLDFPNHDGVYSSLNYSQQNRLFRWGTDLSAGESFVPPTEFTRNNDVYVETLPRPFLHNGNMLYTVGTTVTNGTFLGTTGLLNETTENFDLKVNQRPRKLDSLTTLTNSFTVGSLWNSTGASGALAMMTTSLDHTLRGGGTLNLTYDLVYQPQSYEFISGNHRLSATLIMPAGKRFSATFSGSTYIDAPDSNLVGSLAYRLDNRWRLLFSMTTQSYSGEHFSDLEFTLGRRLGARELQLTYSTYIKRISVDFQATHF